MWFEIKNGFDKDDRYMAAKCKLDKTIIGKIS